MFFNVGDKVKLSELALAFYPDYKNKVFEVCNVSYDGGLHVYILKGVKSIFYEIELTPYSEGSKLIPEIDIDFNLFTWEGICSRVVDGVAHAHDYLPWFEENKDDEFFKCFEGTLKESYDDVKNPKHYQLEGLEPYQSIDIINAIIRRIDNPVRAFRVGNALKYLMRAEKKNGLEDYKKAKVYLDWIIDEMEVTVDENKRRVKRDQGAKL